MSISLLVFDNDRSNIPVAYALCPSGQEETAIAAAVAKGQVNKAKWVDVFEFSDNLQDIYYSVSQEGFEPVHSYWLEAFRSMKETN